MPRTARVALPNYPHHIIQRGHNRQIILAQKSDFEYYLKTLREFREKYDVKVFAYCLMMNHVHLILQPDEDIDGLGRMNKAMKS